MLLLKCIYVIIQMYTCYYSNVYMLLLKCIYVITQIIAINQTNIKHVMFWPIHTHIYINSAIFSWD